jgi:hypothetical protein
METQILNQVGGNGILKVQGEFDAIAPVFISQVNVSSFGYEMANCCVLLALNAGMEGRLFGQHGLLVQDSACSEAIVDAHDVAAAGGAVEPSTKSI